MGSYFVIGCDADGITFDGPLTKHELERRIEHAYYGGKRTNFLSETPRIDGFALIMGEDDLFIIQGRAIVPRPKQTVTHWELP